MEIQNIIKEKIKTVNTQLEEYMKHPDLAQNSIFNAMNYSLFAGGKRLRPIIMLLVCDMLGGDEKEVLPFACALEMIHTYSLIHDDLPAMDNDDLRRGKPTNHKVFGEAAAILAGDALLNMAFEITSSINTENPKRALRAISVLSKASGALGMIGGQVIDIESENKAISHDMLLNLHSLKTGAIIRAAGVIGAVMSGAGEDEIKAVDSYCLNLGLAFQIRDDILDVTGNEETLGKPIGSDSENHKTTFVTLFGLEKSKKAVDEYTGKAISSLSVFKEKAKELTDLANYLTNRSV